MKGVGVALLFVVALCVGLGVIGPWAVLLWVRAVAEVSEPLLQEAARAGALSWTRVAAAVGWAGLGIASGIAAVALWRRRTEAASFGRLRRARTRRAVSSGALAASVVLVGALSPLVNAPRWLEDAGTTMVLTLVWMVLPLILMVAAAAIALGVWALHTSSRAAGFRAGLALVLVGAGGGFGLGGDIAGELIADTQETLADEIVVLTGRTTLPAPGAQPRTAAPTVPPPQRAPADPQRPADQVQSRSIRVFAWNANSGVDADAHGRQMPFIREVIASLDHDVIALSEVQESWMQQIVNASNAAGRRRTSVQGTTGGNQRLQLLFDTNRLERVATEEMTGVVDPASRNRRAPLAVVLRDRHTGREVEFVILHLTRGSRQEGDGIRAAEAARLRNLLATRQPRRDLIVIGDANVDCPVDTAPEGCARAMDELIAGNTLHWVAPDLPHATYCPTPQYTPRMLDVAFVGTASTFARARTSVLTGDAWCDRMADGAHYPIELEVAW